MNEHKEELNIAGDVNEIQKQMIYHELSQKHDYLVRILTLQTRSIIEAFVVIILFIGYQYFITEINWLEIILIGLCSFAGCFYAGYIPRIYWHTSLPVAFGLGGGVIAIIMRYIYSFTLRFIIFTILSVLFFIDIQRNINIFTESKTKDFVLPSQNYARKARIYTYIISILLLLGGIGLIGYKIAWKDKLYQHNGDVYKEIKVSAKPKSNKIIVNVIGKNGKTLPEYTVRIIATQKLFREKPVDSRAKAVMHRKKAVFVTNKKLKKGTTLIIQVKTSDTQDQKKIIIK